MTEKNYEEARKELCLFIKNKAIEKGITYQVIADKTGLQQPNVSRMLNSHYSPSLDNFIKLADAIGVKIKLN